MTNLAERLALPRPRDIVPTVQNGLLVGFFIALAFSISISQLLLALLFGLLLAWPLTVRRVEIDPLAAGRVPIVWRSVEPLRHNPLTRPYLLLVALTVVSAALSGDPGWSLWMARDTLRIATFYVVLWYTRDSVHAARLWLGFLAVLTAMACYGLAQAYVCTVRPEVVPAAWLEAACTHASRVSGPFSIYMTFGGVLLLGTLVILAHLANLPWRRAWWMVPAAAIMLAALAFTYSRNAWLGLAAGVLTLIATARRATRVLIVLLAMLLLAWAVSPATVTDRVRSMANMQDETVRDRVAMWRAGLGMIADHPLLGVGPGQVRAWYPHYRRPEAVRPSTGHLHSSPIQIAAERGLPAFAAWIWIWTVFFGEAWRILGRVGRDRPRDRALVCASLGGISGFLVAGLFEHNFGDAEVVMLAYALMALPFVVERSLSRAEAPAAGPAIGPTPTASNQ